MASVYHRNLILGNPKTEVRLMLTISDLIAVFGLCATLYSLGYMHGKHDSRTQK